MFCVQGTLDLRVQTHWSYAKCSDFPSNEHLQRKGRSHVPLIVCDTPPHACFGSAGANRPRKSASLSPGRSKCTLWAAGQLIVHQREIVGQLCEAVTVTLVDDLLQRTTVPKYRRCFFSHSRADHCASLIQYCSLSSARTFISAQTLCLSSMCSGVKHT